MKNPAKQPHSIAWLWCFSLFLACSDDTKNKERVDVGSDLGMSDLGGPDTGGDHDAGDWPTADPLCTSNGWCWAHPSPHGNNLHGIHGVDGAVFVVGAAGLFQVRIGGRWSVGYTEGGETLRDVWALRPDLAYAVGAADLGLPRAVVYAWDGSTWSQIHELTPRGNYGPLVTPTAVWARSEDEIYVAYGHRIDRFDGSTWTTTTEDLGQTSGLSVGDLWGAESGPVYAVGQTENTFHGGAGFIWRFDGSSWVEEETGSIEALSSITGRSADDIWAAGKSLLRWNGVEWTQESYPGNALSSVSILGDSTWVTSSDWIRWTLQESVSGTWSAYPLPFDVAGSVGPGRRLPTVFASGNEVFFGGEMGYLARLEDASDGGSWTGQREAKLDSISALWPLSGDRALAAASTGLARWDGAAWTTTPLSFGRASHVWGGADDAVVIMAEGDDWPVLAVQTSANAEFQTFPIYSPSAIWGSSLADLMISASYAEPEGNNILDVFRFDGATLIPTDAPGLATELSGGSAQALYGLFGDEIHFYNGETWSLVDRGATNFEDIDGIAHTSLGLVVVGESNRRAATWLYDGTQWRDISPAASLMVSPLADVAASENEVYVLSEVGRVYRWSEETWTVETLATYDNLQAIYVGQDGSIWIRGAFDQVIVKAP